MLTRSVEAGGTEGFDSCRTCCTLFVLLLGSLCHRRGHKQNAEDPLSRLAWVVQRSDLSPHYITLLQHA